MTSAQLAPNSGGSAAGGDPSAAHRLPYDVRPTRYDLRLAPDLDAAVFEGQVLITAEVDRPADRIVLHAADLDITHAVVTAADGRRAETASTGSAGATRADAAPEEALVQVEADEAAERVCLVLPSPLPAGPCTIELRFSGVLNDRLHGFYRSTFTDAAGATRTIATTQFEATDARRAFPCFDEPDRKAVFAVTLDVDAALLAVSNGPVVSDTPLPGGRRRVQFADTIPMSTYLVAFVVGPLEATDPVDVDGIPVRIVHVPGRHDLTSFAVECAAHALRFFTEWFGIAYPAAKLDLVAIPDFAFGAMENLGCVTFRETALLVDPEQSSQLEQQRVADVVSHEIAHMWFGDLVTMRWWNGIWLNEAFATLMELLCVDHFRPQWQRWVSFGMERDVAMATDSLHRTRPVEYPVGPPEEAQGMFDVLTYQKGASVLRMLERYLGEDRFRAGIRRYLNDHRLGNTDTADLWDAIEAASGEPVRQVMDTWITQGGFPLVSVEDRGGTTALDQTPFSFTPVPSVPGTPGPAGGAEPSAIGRDWQVPVLARSLDDPEASARVLLADGGATIGVPPAGVVVNAGGSGFYRVRYTPGHLRQLAGRMAELEPLERCNLLSDTWAGVLAGIADLDDMLVLAEAIGDETDPDVWSQVTGALRFLDHVVTDDARHELATYTRTLVGPLVDRLGWQRRAGDDERAVTLRSLAITIAGTVGADPAVRERCAALHTAALAGTTPLDPDLAAAVVTVVAASGDRATFAQLLDRYRHPATPQEEMRYLYSLGEIPDPDVAAEVFHLALTDIRTQNAPFVIQMLLASREHGPATWSRLCANWLAVMDRTPANIVPRLLDGAKWLCRDPDLAAQVHAFVADNPVRSGQRTVEQILERLDVNVAVTERLARDAGAALRAAAGRLTAHRR